MSIASRAHLNPFLREKQTKKARQPEIVGTELKCYQVLSGVEDGLCLPIIRGKIKDHWYSLLFPGITDVDTDAIAEVPSGKNFLIRTEYQHFRDILNLFERHLITKLRVYQSRYPLGLRDPKMNPITRGVLLTKGYGYYDFIIYLIKQLIKLSHLDEVADLKIIINNRPLVYAVFRPNLNLSVADKPVLLVKTTTLAIEQMMNSDVSYECESSISNWFSTIFY